MNHTNHIFALFGNPVGHSLSPLMHRAAYKAMDIHADYVACCVVNLEQAVMGIRGMNIKGVSVTLPFKTDIMAYLDDIDETARIIGAVNTIRNDHGHLTGFNTDAAGLMNDLQDVISLKGKRVVILGAGGASRSAVFGAIREGAEVTIANRTQEKGQELAREFRCSFCPLAEIIDLEADMIINTTSVGMSPLISQSPLPVKILHRFTWVVDIIYNPLTTQLLQDAQSAGCRIRNGVGMFIQQGAEQIRLWTGQNPPIDLMHQAVLERLTI